MMMYNNMLLGKEYFRTVWMDMAGRKGAKWMPGRKWREM
jgi:hypothetical protein